MGGGGASEHWRESAKKERAREGGVKSKHSIVDKGGYGRLILPSLPMRA